MIFGVPLMFLTTLTTGEMINFAMVGVMIATLVYARSRHSKEDSGEVQRALNAHLIECAHKNGEVETILKSIQSDGKRTERKVDNLAAQLQSVASGGAGTVLFHPTRGEDVP